MVITNIITTTNPTSHSVEELSTILFETDPNPVVILTVLVYLKRQNSNQGRRIFIYSYLIIFQKCQEKINFEILDRYS